MRLTFFAAITLATFGFSAQAATISFVAPSSASGIFDVVVQSTNVFAGRDTTTDGILSYGFNVGVNPLLASFTGATSGPLFDAAITEPGTDVFGAASGFGVFAPVTEPLTLATLHFTRVGAGAVTISISSNLSNLFQGLQFENEPFAESIAGSVRVADAAPTPEPATLTIAALGLAALCIIHLRRRSAR